MADKSVADITDEELKCARIYYITGFFFLPFVWLLILLNWWHCWKVNTAKGKVMHRYLKTALIGCIIWAVVFVTWVIVYQSMWRDVPFFTSIQLTASEGIAWE